VKIYLAGPINGCTREEAKGWRRDVSDALEFTGIQCIDPLRCEPDTGGDNRYDLSYECPLFGTDGAIFGKNRFDVFSCDLLLGFLPTSSRGPSIGTLFEIAWAFDQNKPIILVSDDGAVTEHPLVKRQVQWIVPEISLAVEIIRGLYHHGN
jgi:nucleoside 2-deoxyribosyltransferase